MTSVMYHDATRLGTYVSPGWAAEAPVLSGRRGGEHPWRSLRVERGAPWHRKAAPAMSNETLSDETLAGLAQRACDTLPGCRNYAQTSFVVLQEGFDLHGEPILRALTPFPGIALGGETCDAVVGSLMALGLVYGRDNLGDWDGYLRSLPPARMFCRHFEQQNGARPLSPTPQAFSGHNPEVPRARNADSSAACEGARGAAQSAAAVARELRRIRESSTEQRVMEEPAVPAPDREGVDWGRFVSRREPHTFNPYRPRTWLTTPMPTWYTYPKSAYDGWRSPAIWCGLPEMDSRYWRSGT